MLEMEQKDDQEQVSTEVDSSQQKLNEDNAWQTLYDDETQRYYSFNCSTGESVWLEDTETNESVTQHANDLSQNQGNVFELQPRSSHTFPDEAKSSEFSLKEHPQHSVETHTFEKFEQLHQIRMERFWKRNTRQTMPAICSSFGAFSLEEDAQISVASSEKQAYKIELNIPSGVRYPEAKRHLPALASTLLLGATKIYESNNKRLVDSDESIPPRRSSVAFESKSESKSKSKSKWESERETEPKRMVRKKIGGRPLHNQYTAKRLVAKRRVHHESPTVADTSENEKRKRVEVELQELSKAGMELFNLLDVSGDGFVRTKEVTQAIYSEGAVTEFILNSKVLRPLANKSMASQLVNALRHERDDSGQVSSDTFHSLLHRLLKPKSLRLRQAEFKKLFDLIDGNGDGSLDINELRRALRNNPNVIQLLKRSKFLQPFLRFSTVMKLDDLFRKHDKDKSCSLSWAEFLNLCIMMQ